MSNAHPRVRFVPDVDKEEELRKQRQIERIAKREAMERETERGRRLVYEWLMGHNMVVIGGWYRFERSVNNANLFRLLFDSIVLYIGGPIDRPHDHQQINANVDAFRLAYPTFEQLPRYILQSLGLIHQFFVDEGYVENGDITAPPTVTLDATPEPCPTNVGNNSKGGTME